VAVVQYCKRETAEELQKNCRRTAEELQKK
jgi:hypothetical protein